MKNANELSNLKVLFIDDDRLLRRSMEYYFRKKVSFFLALESAEQALERLKDESFDVVICDYILTGMNGLAFFEALGKTHPDIVKVLVTGYPDDDMSEEVKRIGIDHFISKPFDGKKIERAIAGQ